MRVFNYKTDKVPVDAVYIGRPSKFGNPFIIGRDGTRKQVIDKYRVWINSKPDLVEAAKQELRGKDLVCCCAPKSCHGDVLIEIVEGLI